ncbi:hypothetical protein RA276_31375, partial [Pseudomonas syringae pv. tagetis]
MTDFAAEPKLRVDPAKALMPVIHPRTGETGKKETAKDNAAGAAQGKFGVRKGPLEVEKEWSCLVTALTGISSSYLAKP